MNLSFAERYIFHHLPNNFFVGKCVNLDSNITDKEGRGCESYSNASTVKNHDARCGKHDDEDFNSLEICCNCGGGGFGNFMLF